MSVAMKWGLAGVGLGVLLGFCASRAGAAESSPCASLQGLAAAECAAKLEKAREPAPPGLTPHFPPQPGDPPLARPLTPVEQACGKFADPEQWAKCAAPFQKGQGSTPATPPVRPGWTGHFPPEPGDPPLARPLTPVEQACGKFADPEQWAKCAAPFQKKDQGSTPATR